MPRFREVRVERYWFEKEQLPAISVKASPYSQSWVRTELSARANGAGHVTYSSWGYRDRVAGEFARQRLRRMLCSLVRKRER
jgi:hypothetical protein